MKPIQIIVVINNMMYMLFKRANNKTGNKVLKMIINPPIVGFPLFLSDHQVLNLL